MLRFIHISDTHINGDPNYEHYGHKPRANLVQLLSIIDKLPFSFDFILHTGDIVEDQSEAAYVEAQKIFQSSRFPIYYVSGNHDHSIRLQKHLLKQKDAKERYDYAFIKNGVQVVILDTRGPVDPAGRLEDSQIEWLSQYCLKDGPPLVVALHHPPVALGSPWLDEITVMPAAMLLENPKPFLDLLQKAKNRLRGVFFGHVHRAFQVYQDGILFSSAPSAFGQLKTWPELKKPLPAPEEAPGYCVVTVDGEKTIVQQYTFQSQDH